MNQLVHLIALRKPFLLLGTAALLVSSSLTLSSCGEKETTVTPQEPLTVQLATTATLGSFLVDADGNTLYYFTLDTGGTSMCPSGPCLDAWPIFYDAKLTVGNGLKASDFATITHPNGQLQTTYKGWPLYYYAIKNTTTGQYTREKPGEALGQDLGHHWFVVRTDYSLMVGTKALLDKNTNTTSLKNFLIDPQGRTLYTYAKDSKSPSTLPTNCTGSCATAWPVFFNSSVSLPTFADLKASDFGTITRTDGTGNSTQKQLTYKGMPLYYCAGDNQTPGKTEGHNLTTNGEPWVVAEF
ncbi:hypothetical protein [Hymenobacter volaticus]|uniref:Lipoprotein n=1 Tax=Hymenobacter volaticus TaxID=2932254 RepID=A0ABY4GEY2_9BACT|nr:hypothetical protein [Hymenobacter volaticus]UOQ69486.1 hypothetical protein MUN86_28835 [Hymenobacter volaticus]